jgi:autotransporter-associated beta strand protein
MPNTVPNATTDTATFGTSDTTSIAMAAPINLASFTFAPGASAYVISVVNNQLVELWGSPNIINNSGVEQNFVVDGGVLKLHGSETLDSTIHFEVLGADSNGHYGQFWLQGGINLGTARLDFEGGDGYRVQGSSGVIFAGSTAGSSTIVVHRGVNRGYPGNLVFESGSAGAANIIAEGSDNRTTGGGYVAFSNAFAGTSIVTLQRPPAADGLPATAIFSLFADAQASTLLAEGGSLVFTYASKGGTARAVLTARGSLDISGLSSFETDGLTIGSVEGDRTAVVSLGSRKLTVGGNNLSTTFAGLIQDGGLSGGTGGSLAKIGTKTLTLSGANLYTGGTTVTSGDFLVANHTGSATGTGPVQVDAGRIGGAGTIVGPLTIGTGSGSGATLIPAAGTKKEVTTTVQSALTLKADGTYNCAVNTTSGASDSVVANGVTIDSSATFVLHAKGNGTLAPGTVITPINNTAATPIASNFNGLPEGSTIVAGNNTYEVSYQGGDGNDLTLTVL